MNQPPARIYVFTWLALLVLLGLSAGSSLINLGTFNVVSNFGIAAAKAALVLFLFIRIRRSARTVQLTAGIGLLWLLLLIGLALNDLLARSA
jgi:cytochrome c oxidase subunit 4